MDVGGGGFDSSKLHTFRMVMDVGKIDMLDDNVENWVYLS